jgi:hypothetical protein
LTVLYKVCRFQDTTGRSGAAQFLDPALKEYGWIQEEYRRTPGCCVADLQRFSATLS